MIYKDGKLITSIGRAIIDNKKSAKKTIHKVYLGAKLVWITIYDAIRSCFGGGTWIGDRNWINDDNWKDN